MAPTKSPVGAMDWVNKVTLERYGSGRLRQVDRDYFTFLFVYKYVGGIKSLQIQQILQKQL